MKKLSLVIVFILGTHSAVAKEKLTVLTAYHEDVVARYETAFEQANPDIDLIVLWRMPHDALPYLRQPEQGGVDVYWSAAQQNFLSLKQQGAWQKLGIDRNGLPDNLGAMPLADPGGYFCISEMAGYGFAVNPQYLKKHSLAMPKTWQDLADARYQDHLALPVPSKVGFAPMMIDSVLQQYGWEKGWAILAGIIANARLAESGATFITDIIGSGERGIGPAIDFFTASAIANGGALQFVYPEPVAYSPGHIAITASSRHVDAARRFVSFILSDTGQKMMFHADISKLPARPGVYSNKPAGYFDPFAASEQHAVVYDPSTALPRLALNNALFDRVFSDHLPLMQKLWQRWREQELRGDGDRTENLAQIRTLLTAAPIDALKAQQPALQNLFAQRTHDAHAETQAKAMEQDWSKAMAGRYAEADKLLNELMP